MATVYYTELIVKMTNALNDNEHIPTIVCNRTTIPDRTGFMLGKTNRSPLPEILETAHFLENSGVGVIGVPCVTAHFFYDRYAGECRVPIINMVRETAQYLKGVGVKKVGIMATEGTVSCGFLQRELEEQGFLVTVPGKKGQSLLMGIIYNQIKATKAVDLTDFFQAEQELRDAGAEVILLGCTELSLIKKEYRLGHGFLDMMELLAACSVIQCQAALKPEYKNLIT